MKKYAQTHSDWLLAHQGTFTQDEMDYHLKMIGFLQHERLVHLPVMLVSIIGFIALVIIGLFIPSYVVFLGIAICFILSLCYILHYFFLENTVQDWYRVYTTWKLTNMSVSK